MFLLDLALVDPKLISDTDEDEGRVVCANCRTPITERKYMAGIQGGSPFRTFTNPFGISFNLITFRYCENVMDCSDPSSEATWFPGYAWSVLECGKCREHLGWHYCGAGLEPYQFYGLIRENLIRPV